MYVSIIQLSFNRMEKTSISPNTSIEELAELAKSQNSTIYQQVASHPNTSPNTLEQLFEKYPKDVLNNPSMDLLVLENPKLFENFFWRNTLCFERDFLPLFYQNWAANHSNYFIRSVIASSHKTSSEVIEILSRDLNYDVIHALLRNSKLKIDILEKLAIFAMKPENSGNTLIFEIGLHPNINYALRNKLYLFYKEQRDNFDDVLGKTKINCYDDFSRIVQATSLEMMRLGWTKHIGAKYLKKNYRRRSHLQLTNEQLIEFWKYLSGLPNP